MAKTYICTRCKEHCSVEIHGTEFASNCCTASMLDEAGETLYLFELIRDICEEQRQLCEEEIYFAKMGDYESLSKKILGAPLVKLERILG